jgi:hypothetical protein
LPDVRFDRIRREHQPVRDVRIGRSLGHQLDDLALTASEQTSRPVVALGCSSLRLRHRVRQPDPCVANLVHRGFGGGERSPESVAARANSIEHRGPRDGVAEAGGEH